IHTCQNETYTISNRADSIPTPKTNTANGINATDGTGRKNSMVELVNFRKKLDEPIMKPSIAAATTAISMPIDQARKVSQTAIQKTESPNFTTESADAADAGGIYRASTEPSSGGSSQLARDGSVPPGPNSRFAPGGRRCRTA